jgi:alpha-1,3-mannosyltransferase
VLLEVLESTLIFLNDMLICVDGILELIYQRLVQRADMVGAMDWIDNNSSFCDFRVATSMSDLFLEIPRSGS